LKEIETITLIRGPETHRYKLANKQAMLVKVEARTWCVCSETGGSYSFKIGGAIGVGPTFSQKRVHLAQRKLVA